MVDLEMSDDTVSSAVSRLVRNLVGISNDDTRLFWVADECREQLEKHDWICEVKGADYSVQRLRLVHRVTGEMRNDMR